MRKKERTVFHYLLYLFRCIPGSREISHIRTDFHPFIQFRHLLDTRSATCVPIVQNERLSNDIRLCPYPSRRILYLKVREWFSYPFIKSSAIIPLLRVLFLRKPDISLHSPVKFCLYSDVFPMRYVLPHLSA